MNLNLPAVKARSALLLAGLVLAGCQSLPQTAEVNQLRPAAGPVPDWPHGREFVVDGPSSDFRIIVQPAGRLARFGHAHVLGGPALSGRLVLADDWRDSAVELLIRVEDLVLDQPDWRIDEGFPPQLPAGAIEATRENLLSPAVLDAAAHPLIHIRSLSLSGPQFQPDLKIRIGLRGQERELTVPISLELSEQVLIASGRFGFDQSEFGIEPFSALGGALAVADELLVRFRIVARPAD